jgi:hypothetical protein
MDSMVGNKEKCIYLAENRTPSFELVASRYTDSDNPFFVIIC